MGGWRRIGWLKAMATAFAILSFLYAVAACWTVYSGKAVVDFVSFWAAGSLTSAGAPASAYDLKTHWLAEQTALPFAGLLPFPYPPPFLLVVAPFGYVPFKLAFAVWVGAGASLYLLAARRVAPLPFSLCHPQFVSNAAIGQNGFLTTALFLAGTSLLATSPLLGGMVLGLLAIKPQLALMLPVALLAAREWRAIAGGIVSALSINLIAAAILGLTTYAAFLDILPHYSGWLAEGRWPWQEIASTFGFLRYFGVPQAAAIGLHSLVALGAAVLVWREWSNRSERRVPMLAAATILAPPYVLTYDALLLVIPFGWLIGRGERSLVVGLIWLLSALPVMVHFGDFTAPNTIPLAALLSIWAILRIPGGIAAESAPGRVPAS